MRKRLVLIQLSRALVPIMVMLFHVSVNMEGYWEYNLLGLSSLPISGGVNYFFALSGFMLFYIYQKKLGQPKQLKGFLQSRFVRIYPVYFVLTLIAIPVLVFFPYLGVGHEINYNTIVHSLLLIPEVDGVKPVLDVAWSLVYTVYFYMIFSVLFFSKKVFSTIFLTTWTIISIAFATNILWAEQFIPYFFFYQYNLIFLAGMLCAYAVTRFQPSMLVSAALIIIGLAGFPLTWLNYFNPVLDNSYYDLYTGLASVFIIYGLASIDMKKDIRIPSALNYLGSASLSIYLAHNLVLNTFSEIFSRTGVYYAAGPVVTSISLLVIITFFGCLVHSFIEKPLTAKLKKTITSNGSPITETQKAIPGTGASQVI
ncbi:acyltransferase [Bacillus sp. P14.5]|uniref:acyltransferase family protein n=1 Tax=Bacillus sp. P14.5 TaxID=1983400 RepID=UPI000DEB6832|nr:acyltransferase [Bacillus sp. P14.5]